MNRKSFTNSSVRSPFTTPHVVQCLSVRLLLANERGALGAGEDEGSQRSFAYAPHCGDT